MMGVRTGGRGGWRRAVTAVLAGLLLLCAGCGGSSEGSMRGGATSLPPPLPEGVTFHEAPEDGVRAPAFTVDLVDGTPVTISDLWEDRPVVLLFTSSWCSHCAELHVELAELVDGYDDAVTLVAVAGDDDLESLRTYVREHGLDHPVALESDEAWLKYAVREPPLVALVAPGGHLVRGWPGGPGEIQDLQAEIDALFERRDDN